MRLAVFFIATFWHEATFAFCRLSTITYNFREAVFFTAFKSSRDMSVFSLPRIGDLFLSGFKQCAWWTVQVTRPAKVEQ